MTRRPLVTLLALALADTARRFDLDIVYANGVIAARPR